MEDRCKRKADQGCGKRAAENDDKRVAVGEHPDVAAHHNKRGKDDRSGNKTERRCDIHENPHPNALSAQRPKDPSPCALKGGLPVKVPMPDGALCPDAADTLEIQAFPG
jgi:hypothetical protein